jgi:hypothetical protein
VPRRTWLDSKIDVFLGEFAASSVHLDRQRASELISGQVRAVATRMGVTEATARIYLDDEIVKEMARRMLFDVAGERPGADLMEAPRTVPPTNPVPGNSLGSGNGLQRGGTPCDLGAGNWNPPRRNTLTTWLNRTRHRLAPLRCRICFIWVEATPPRGVAGRSRIRAKDLAQFLPRPSASGGKERMSLRLLVKRLGRQVDAIRPHDGSCLHIDPNPGEVGRVV